MKFQQLLLSVLVCLGLFLALQFSKSNWTASDAVSWPHEMFKAGDTVKAAEIWVEDSPGERIESGAIGSVPDEHIESSAMGSVLCRHNTESFEKGNHTGYMLAGGGSAEDASEGFKKGIGDMVINHFVRAWGCAVRNNLKVVCVSQMFETDDKRHKTENLGFLFGCINNFIACGRIIGWGELKFAWTEDEYNVSLAVAQTKAFPNVNLQDSKVSAFGTQRGFLAPDGRPVYRTASDCETSRKGKDQSIGLDLLRHQYTFMYVHMQRSAPLWSSPPTKLWRIGFTIRRGDSIRETVSSNCRYLNDIYTSSEGKIHPGNTQVLVFSETSFDDPEFDCFRNRTEVTLALGLKSTTHHDSRSRWMRDVDHLAQSHIFKGAYSTFTTLIASLLHPSAIGGRHTDAKNQVRTLLGSHSHPFKGVDFRFRD